MQRIRRQRGLSGFLALALMVSLSVPEVSHIIAHVHDADHHAAPAGTHADDDHHGPAHEGNPAADEHDGDHPHIDIAAVAPTKIPAVQAVIVLAAYRLIAIERASTPVSHNADPIPPGDWVHGPPPPARAPPRV